MNERGAGKQERSAGLGRIQERSGGLERMQERSSSSRRNTRTVKKLRPVKALIIRECCSVADACKKMAALHIDAILLTDVDSVLCGIFTDKDLAIRVIGKELKPEDTPMSSVMTRNPIYVSNNTSVDHALRKMLQGNFRHLPVVEDGQVVALVNINKCLYDAIVSLEWELGVLAAANDLANTLSASSTSIEALREQTFQPTVGSLIMQSFKALILVPDETVDTCTRKMLEFNSDYVIIASGKDPQGIFTSKDLLTRVVARSLPPTTAVEKVMTRNVECATLDTTILDALHIMHDGRFSHLPILDQENGIVGCIGILELLEGSLVNVDEELKNTSDSGTAERSDISANLTSETIAAEAVRTVYPSLWLPNYFSFKVEDCKGCVHRFNYGTQSLHELVSAIALRIGKQEGSLHVLYKDDEGDLILLSSDSDLSLAVSFAKAFGMKVLRLYVEYPNVESSNKPGRWRIFRKTVIASILVIVGLGFFFHSRHNSEEPWTVVWDRLINLKHQVLINYFN